MPEKHFSRFVAFNLCFLVCFLVSFNITKAYDVPSATSPKYDKLYLLIPDSDLNKKFEEVLIAINYDEKIFGSKSDFYKNFVKNLNFFLVKNILDEFNLSDDDFDYDDDKNLKVFLEILKTSDSVKRNEFLYSLKNYLNEFDLNRIINKSFSDLYTDYVKYYGSMYNFVTDKKDSSSDSKSKHYYELLTFSEKNKKNELYKFFLNLIRKYDIFENKNKENIDKIYIFIQELKFIQSNMDFLKYDDFIMNINNHLVNIEIIDKICDDFYYSNYYPKCVENERRYLYEIGGNILRFYSENFLKLYKKVTDNRFITNEYPYNDNYENLYKLKISYNEIIIDIYNFEYRFDYFYELKKLNNDYKKIIDAFEKKIALIEDDPYKFHVNNNGLLSLMKKFSQNLAESEFNVNKKFNEIILGEINKLKEELFDCIEKTDSSKIVSNKIENIKRCITISNRFFDFLNKIPVDYVESNNNIRVEKNFFERIAKKLNDDLASYNKQINR